MNDRHGISSEVPNRTRLINCAQTAGGSNRRRFYSMRANRARPYCASSGPRMCPLSAPPAQGRPRPEVRPSAPQRRPGPKSQPIRRPSKSQNEVPMETSEPTREPSLFRWKPHGARGGTPANTAGPYGELLLPDEHERNVRHRLARRARERPATHGVLDAMRQPRIASRRARRSDGLDLPGGVHRDGGRDLGR